MKVQYTAADGEMCATNTTKEWGDVDTLSPADPYADVPWWQRRENETRVQQHPLLETDTAHRYKSWSMTDMDRIMAKLPPLDRGALPWIAEFEQSVAQDRLALADVRALLIKLKATPALLAAEERAGSKGHLDGVDFPEVRADYWRSLKESYPTKNNYGALSSLTLGPNGEVYAYIQRAFTLWEHSTGERPDLSDATEGHWRHGVQRGLPEKVQQKLEDVVGLDNMPTSVWKDHIVHCIAKQRAARSAKEEEATALENKLLKLQIAKLTACTDQEKAKAVIEAPVVTEQARAASQPMGGVPVVAVQPPPFQQVAASWQGQQPYPAPTYQQRGGYPQSPITCWTCGQGGHISRDCPNRTWGIPMTVGVGPRPRGTGRAR